MSDVPNLGRWQEFFPTVEMVVNSFSNRTTGYSPFYLMYCYHPIVPIELLKGDESTNVEPLLKFLERTQEVWSIACLQMEKAVVTQKVIMTRRYEYTIFCWGFGFAEHPKLEPKGPSA